MTKVVEKKKKNNGKANKLSEKEKRFCREYVCYLNVTKAAKLAGYSERSASVIGTRLLERAKVKQHVEYLQRNLAEAAEITALQIVNEHKKIAWCSLGDLYRDWFDIKELDALTEDQRSCIQSIETRETSGGITTIKIKLYDKQRALDSIALLLGFNAPEKQELTGPDGKALFQDIIIQKNYGD